MNFIIVISIILITLSLFGGFYYYQLNQKLENIENIENIENMINKQEEIEETINFDEMEHLGYLFKNGTNENFDNLNVYFNKITKDFIALTQEQMLINLGKESINEGDKLNINNEMYIVKLGEN